MVSRRTSNPQLKEVQEPNVGRQSCPVDDKQQGSPVHSARQLVSQFTLSVAHLKRFDTRMSLLQILVQPVPLRNKLFLSVPTHINAPTG